MNLEEKTVKQNYIYKGRIINLRVDEAEIPNGAIRTREVIEHSGGVCVVPITDKNEIITVKQFRYPYMVAPASPMASFSCRGSRMPTRLEGMEARHPSRSI